MGQEMMQQWATKQETKKASEAKQNGLNRHTKKLSWHTTFGIIEVKEIGTKRI